MNTYFVALICVLGISIGQILFKYSALCLQRSGSIFSLATLIPLVSAFALYGVTTIAWVWVLQKIPLGRVYPFMALAFVIVPVGGYFIFSEVFSIQYVIGIVLIVVGIVVTTMA